MDMNRLCMMDTTTHDHDQKEFANKNGEKENGLIKTNKKSQNTSGSLQVIE
jgi:hypothetical protein